MTLGENTKRLTQFNPLNWLSAYLETHYVKFSFLIIIKVELPIRYKNMFVYNIIFLSLVMDYPLFFKANRFLVGILNSVL